MKFTLKYAKKFSDIVMDIYHDMEDPDYMKAAMKAKAVVEEKEKIEISEAEIGSLLSGEIIMGIATEFTPRKEVRAFLKAEAHKAKLHEFKI
jgi:hypothetical protein